MANAQFNYYFGNIHSHTEYSDGNKDSLTSGVSTPGQSFQFAKNSYHVDFWGISEHNHFTATNNPGMLLARYQPGLYQADTATQNGYFVAMYGIEFGTISTGGHVVTYGLPGLVGWDTVAGIPNYATFCAKGDYSGYWTIAQNFPNTFSTLAHPETGDYNDLLLSAPYNPTADSQVVGTAVRSGSAFSTTTNYSDPPATSYEFQFRRALAKGYHLGPTLDHDNHYTTFGRTLMGRTVILATQLHRDSLIAAYKARRFYASDDWNAEVQFTVNSAVMGSVIQSNGGSQIQVQVNDLDLGESIASIQIYYGRPGSGNISTILTTSLNTNTLNFTHQPMPGDSVYYYAKIQQTDGDLIWTAPIWVYRQALPLPLHLLSFDGEATPRGSELNIRVNEIENGAHLVIEHSENGNQFNDLTTYTLNGFKEENSFNYLHREANQGVHYYRLRYEGLDGEIDYSQVISLRFAAATSNFTLFPVPASDLLNLKYISTSSKKAVYRIFNIDGQCVYASNIVLSPGENLLQTNMQDLPSGIYYLVLQTDHQRLVDVQFMKK